MSVDAILQFRDALRARGIDPPAELLTDGTLGRCDAKGKAGKRDACYILHLDGVPAGGFNNHCDGRGWENWRADIERTLTQAEQAEEQRRAAAARQRRTDDQQRRQAAASADALRRWTKAKVATADHPYLARKGIWPHGARQAGEELLVPMVDEHRVLVNLQRIGADGVKRFLSGGRTRGAFHVIDDGLLDDTAVFIAEGFATGATVAEATALPVFVAFSASNLVATAHIANRSHQHAALVIAADDDTKPGSSRNPGIDAARTAADQLDQCVLVTPDFSGLDDGGARSDFNDLLRLAGWRVVREQLEAAEKAAT